MECKRARLRSVVYRCVASKFAAKNRASSRLGFKLVRHVRFSSEYQNAVTNDEVQRLRLKVCFVLHSPLGRGRALGRDT